MTLGMPREYLPYFIGSVGTGRMHFLLPKTGLLASNVFLGDVPWFT